MLTQELTPEGQASIIAVNICRQANNVAAAHAKFKANGIPANPNAPGGGTPAVTAAQYETALGANAAILDAILAANPQS